MFHWMPRGCFRTRSALSRLLEFILGRGRMPTFYISPPPVLGCSPRLRATPQLHQSELVVRQTLEGSTRVQYTVLEELHSSSKTRKVPPAAVSAPLECPATANPSRVRPVIAASSLHRLGVTGCASFLLAVDEERAEGDQARDYVCYFRSVRTPFCRV